MRRGWMGMLWVVAIGLIAGCSSADTTAGTSSANTGTGSGGSVSASSGSNGTDPSGTDSATSAPSLTQPGGASNSTPDGTALTIPITDNTDPTGTTGPTEVTQPSGTNDTTTQSTAPVDTFVDVPPSGPCAFTAPVPMGEVTWVQDGQLRALADGATPTCLLDGVDGGSPQAWSSDAGRVLLDPSTSATASGRRSTGFDHTMAAVVLSAPKGTATIAVDPVTHRLIRHGSDGAESDISFLAKTDEAIYHPGGTRIIAVGTDAAGNYGIWLSSNLGKEPKQVLSVADPSTPVTDLAFSADATQLYFIHGFVHRLTMAVLQLDEVGQADRGEANLVVSTLEQGTAAWSVGPCDSTGTVLMSSPILSQPADLRTMTGSPFVGSDVTLQPVGWLSGYRVVLAVRPSGCDGPADLWIWSTVDGFRHVAHGALASAVRLPRAAFRDLPDVIDQAAPG